MPKSKKEVLGPPASETYKYKKIKSNKNLGPEQPKKIIEKLSTKPKPKLNRSEAAKKVWATKRNKIIQGINNYWARKKTEAKA